MTSKAFQNAETLAGVSVEADPGDNGFFPDVDATAKIVRMRDRLFLGGGAAFTGNRAGTQGSFVPDDTAGNNWAPRDSALLVAQDIGLMGITAYVSNDNMDLTGGEPTESIGVSGFVINNQATRTSWALYGDIQHEAGVATYGLEIACKNKSANDYADTPHLIQGGVYGVWLAGGGDDRVGGASTNPSNTALRIGKNAYGSNGWNKGIVFYADGLTGTDGTTGTGTAIEMATRQKIAWRAPGNYAGFEINCEVSGTGLNSSMIVSDNSIRFRGTASAELLHLAHQASAVNYLQIINRATGSAPRLSALGTDTNIDLELYTTGAGVLRFGTHSALAAETVSGYITIKDAGGVVRKLAVVS